MFERETQTCLCLRRASGRKAKMKVKRRRTSGIIEKIKGNRNSVTKLEKRTEELISLRQWERR